MAGDEQSGEGEVTRDTVFISYSHHDEKWKDRLLPHLAPLERHCRLEVWDDRQIRAGEAWYARIRAVLDRTRVAICLISHHFLASRFCMDEEIPYLLQRRWAGELDIVPILISHCLWKREPWLARIQMMPRDGIGLMELRKGKRRRVLTDMVEQIFAAVEAGRPVVERLRHPDLPPPELIQLDRLPESGDLLLGRRDEWQALDAAWPDPETRVMVLRAPGGVGKSTLVKVWTDAIHDRGLAGLERAFGWSFYSQGTGERVTAADLFIAEALAWFGDPDPREGDPWSRGERLADLIAQRRTLLVLDGLEPLQEGTARDDTLRGAIKDPGLRTLLERLARHNPGLCIITTREPVSDLRETAGVVDLPLDHLSPVACRALLRTAGVRGSDAELEAAAADLDHHALAITLLGRLRGEGVNRHIDDAPALPALAEVAVDDGRHPRRVMEAWAEHLRARGEHAELELLGVLGCFDRPAERRAVMAAIRPPMVAGLNGHLRPSYDAMGRVVTPLDAALERLRAAGLVARDRRQGRHRLAVDNGEVDAHPLVRTHFGARLEAAAPAAWRAAHERLYRFFASEAPALPDTLAEMAPLFRAVVHGCAAGRHQEALVEVYERRILRGGVETYTVKKLGAVAAGLAALSAFFATPRSDPQPSLSAPAQAAVLAQAAFHLQALGRLADAVARSEAGLTRHLELADWQNAAFGAGILSELLLTLGRLGTEDGAPSTEREAPAPRASGVLSADRPADGAEDDPARVAAGVAASALAAARAAVRYADRSGDGFQRLAMRTTLADALHHRGELKAARALFVEAEQMQAEQQPIYPLLSMLQGYRYGDLLLTLGDPAEARRRAETTVPWAEAHGWLLDIALGHLLLGRAALAAAPDSRHPDAALARRHLDAAVTGLRKAGMLDEQPRGHLARAALHRFTGDYPAAHRDLDDARTIAARGGMRLFLTDCDLEAARLAVAEGDHDAAHRFYTAAAEAVAEIGYHRRDPELAALRADLGIEAG